MTKEEGCCESKGCCSGKKDPESQDELKESGCGHNHSHGHSHHHSEGEDDHGDIEAVIPVITGHQKKDKSVLCLAVVRESGADVVLFDASGSPRSFSYQPKGGKSDAASGKVCFSSHGHPAADDFLTPCFDEDGNHGDPEESCFCGVETPHLHAHWHDPKTCDGSDVANDAKPTAGGDSEAALMSLAKLTLHPVDQNHEEHNMLHIPISEQMPKECNANEFFSSLSSSGHNESSLQNRRRMHKVQHDDHVDYLVHDDATDGLHLEHPCDGCGKDDVHGRFRCVGKRRLTNLSNHNDGMNLHFFEIAPRPFSILEFFKDVFTPESGRVTVVRPVSETTTDISPCCQSGSCGAAAAVGVTDTVCSKDDDAPAVPDCCSSGKCVASVMPPELLDPLPGNGAGGAKTVRSTLVCTQICCSAEIPMINKIVEPLEGVAKVMINVPLKQVIVEHDPNVITGKDIEGVLSKNRFGATLKRDGGAGLSDRSTGRSQFHVQKICCASEIPAINTILTPIEGVSNVSINVTTKMVYVDHDTGVVSAQNLCDALNKVAFGASVKKDAGKSAGAGTPAYVKSTLSFSGAEPDTDSLKDLLRSFKPSQMESFVVDVPSKTITVTHNPLLLPLQNVVARVEEQTDLHVNIVTDGADGLTWDFKTLDQSGAQTAVNQGEATPWPKPTVIMSGCFWIISMLSFIGGDWEYLKYVALLSVVFGIPGIAIKAFHTMRRFMFDTNCLMLFAVIGAVALEEYTEAAAVTFLFAFSEWLEVRATTRARNALSAIVQLRPDFAYIVHPTTKEQLIVAATDVPVGAIVAVKTGDKIPCDGVVVEGNSAVDESSLTGESRPVRKGPKDIVSGGTVNCGQTHLMIQTTATADNSAISRLVTLVEEAQANRSQTEKMVDEFAKVYTPIVVLAALCMCTIPWAFGTDTGREWTNNGLVLIVVACPCALIISTPVTYVAGLAATAQRGILIKGGAHLEALGLVKAICFDKTGTLTQGSFALLSINNIGDKYSRKEVLEYLVLMEERANHPLALAIVDGARNEGIVSPKHKPVKDHTFLAGEGLSGQIDGKQIYVGNERLFKRLGLFEGLPQDLMNLVGNWEAMAGTVGFMSIEGDGVVCAYCVADAVRSESMEVVEALHKLGISVNMLTGDNNDAARAIGNLVGLKDDGIKSQLLPEEKLQFITSLKEGQAKRSVLSNPMSKRQLVCMVGDGVNDAPALAAADIGVAMGVGAALAMETADVTLLDSNLKKLLYSLQMGRRVLWKIKENVAFSLIVKFLVLGFTIAGKVQLWAAIVSDVGAMIIVTLNGMRLLPNMVIDREKMGDIENVTYHSQVSDMSSGNQKELEVEKVPIEIDFGSSDGTDEIPHHDHHHDHQHHSCPGHQHGHEHSSEDNTSDCQHQKPGKEAEEAADSGHHHRHHHHEQPAPELEHQCSGHSHSGHSHSDTRHEGHHQHQKHAEEAEDTGHHHMHHHHHEQPAPEKEHQCSGHSHSGHSHSDNAHESGHSHSDNAHEGNHQHQIHGKEAVEAAEAVDSGHHHIHHHHHEQPASVKENKCSGHSHSGHSHSHNGHEGH